VEINLIQLAKTPYVIFTKLLSIILWLLMIHVFGGVIFDKVIFYEVIEWHF
jgi:hypothetical protein